LRTTVRNENCICEEIKSKLNKTTTLPVVLYGCETWFPTLREEHRLRVFENSAEENI
jgi:hypothetical protein